ncbi:MAG: two-component system cell cycle sensor histidine kinase/response regulator CckA [Candidatus Latescibacterota bacterium]
MNNKRILIVEDEAVVALNIRTELEEMGYDVAAIVDTGEEAISEIATYRPDLILMDIQLAGVMDGIETAAKINQHFDIPIIYLTANSNDATFQHAKLSGPSAFLNKPYRRAELGKAVDLALDQHRRTKSTRELLAAVVQHSHDAIISSDLKGVVSTWNQGAARIYGIDSEQAIDRPILQLFPEADELPALLARASAGERVEYIGQRRNTHGKTLHISHVLSPIRDENGQVMGVSSIDRDISETVKAEQALRRAREELEDRVLERTAELREANEQLQNEITERKEMEKEVVRLERLRALGELATGISHNLNNLLVGIMGPAEALQQSKTPAEAREWAQLILETGQRATTLVKRLNNAVRSQHEAVEAVEAPETLREAIKSAQHYWQRKEKCDTDHLSIALDIHAVPPISANPIGLRDAIYNILLNAADALPKGGRIDIGMRQVERHVLIEISDNGLGMDEEIQRRVFEPFFTTKASVGSGLGLTSAERIISSWGGRIEVRSEVGSGSCFILCLPIWESLPTPSTLPSLHLFIADEDGPVSQVLHKWLATEHQVTLATSGPQALERFDPELHEIALIDWGLPGLAGDQLVQQLRVLHPHLVAIILSGWHLEESDPHFEVFDLALQKPFNLAALDQVLHQAVELRDQRAPSRP